MLSDVFHLVMQMYMHEEKEHKLEALKKEAELYALRSQINPHFLYNTLDSIRGQLIGNDLADVAEIIESLSNLFRYSIDSRTVYNTLEQELDNVRDYMRIMRFRLGDRVSFQVLIDPSEMFILNCEVPKLTLQPIVENAIEHGLAHTAGNGKIILRATAFEDRIAIVVSDNGGGIDPERLEKRERELPQRRCLHEQRTGNGARADQRTRAHPHAASRRGVWPAHKQRSGRGNRGACAAANSHHARGAGGGPMRKIALEFRNVELADLTAR